MSAPSNIRAPLLGLGTALAALLASGPSMAGTPGAAYTSIFDIKTDGKRAQGKTALLPVHRAGTNASTATLIVCEGDMNMIMLSFASKQKGLIKAIPKSEKKCIPILFQIKLAHENLLQGRLLAIPGVQALLPAAPPPGVQYASMDDLALDGKRSRGKLAVLRIALTDIEEGRKNQIKGHVCGEDLISGSVVLSWKADKSGDIEKLPVRSDAPCFEMKVKVLDNDMRWQLLYLDTVGGPHAQGD